MSNKWHQTTGSNARLIGQSTPLSPDPGCFAACPRCGFPMEGLPDPLCPECGARTVIPSFYQRQHIQARVMLVATVLIAVSTPVSTSVVGLAGATFDVILLLWCFTLGIQLVWGLGSIIIWDMCFRIAKRTPVARVRFWSFASVLIGLGCGVIWPCVIGVIVY